MILEDILKYDHIVIQCHDNPDADALGSAFGMYRFLQSYHKEAIMIYAGKYQVNKSNLKLMIEELNIPIHYIQTQEEFDRLFLFDDDSDFAFPELLVTVDCQYGQGNVTRFEAKNVAVIDHHQISGPLPEMSEVRSNLGSCCTVVWNLLRKMEFDFSVDEELSTALYYGLMTDTNDFAEISHPLDKDMWDQVEARKTAITLFRNSNLSQAELAIAGKALLSYDYSPEHRYAIVRTEPCDPNVLGLISDMLLEVDTVDNALVYSVLPFGVKISVRSCIKEVKANGLAEYIAEGIGNGGGHVIKAGGFLQRELLEKNGYIAHYEAPYIHTFLSERMHNYFSGTEIIYADQYQADLSDMQLVCKKQFLLGYVDAKQVVPEDSRVKIRTLEGDLDIKVDEDTYIMIGIDGEIYPIEKGRFLKSYKYSDEPYVYPGDYEPTIKDLETGKSISIMSYAKACISTGSAQVYVRKLDHRVKIFTRWDPDNYYLGKENDYIGVRADNLQDVYIIAGDIFDKTYKFL